MTKPRTGQAPSKLGRDEFRIRFLSTFEQSSYDGVRQAIDQIEAVAWDNYAHGRKPLRTEKAGQGYADPDYDLSVEWREASEKLKAAEKRQKDPRTASRVLIICGSDRNDGSCPGEMSKSYRLTQIARMELEAEGIEVDVLDLSLLISDYDRHIHPCKGCVSTAMPLCHWPCSCYPNYSLRQTGDWMNEIYERWVSAHGIIMISPVYWYQSPSALKLMIDRLVCADGGNPDPTSTSGKNAEKAKAIEMEGWDYPKHLAGRAYGLMIHGDVAGIEGTRRALSDWLDWMGLIDAGPQARLDRYIGYYKPYAESHETLDGDVAVQGEMRNVALAVCNAVRQLRAGQLRQPDGELKRIRPK
ncbi:flavodoxin family protein [Noviherbaspirillum galbum]|uniref:Flavodoxin family protein n=1 Tax=Noviherbaspirillum galbum TaxID=2709383 RepID=A0A6B3SJL9_9BURK|nr:flavodoxin family protein [Noviherbaspirillum galbum]NEX60920.1 flavodoxin family protein [Noviherbaspirillum galbum]